MSASSASTMLSTRFWWASPTSARASPSLPAKASTTPWNSWLCPTGTVAILHAVPNDSCNSPTKAIRSTFSASHLLTTMATATPCLTARSKNRRALISTPPAALMTSTAVSTADRPMTTWPVKSEKPGQSMRLTWRSFQAACRTAASMDALRSFSSSSKSLVLVPSSDVPSRVTMPDVCSIASARSVLPL